MLKRSCFSLRTKLSMPKWIIFDFHGNSFKLKNLRPLTKDGLMGEGLSAFKGQSRPYILTKESYPLVSSCGNKRKKFVPDPNQKNNFAIEDLFNHAEIWRQFLNHLSSFTFKENTFCFCKIFVTVLHSHYRRKVLNILFAPLFSWKANNKRVSNHPFIASRKKIPS